MAGKIFYRERREVGEGDQTPRYNLVAVADVKLKIHVTHMRKIAKAVDAELVELTVPDKGHKVAIGD
jgi:hypothetical protein